MLQTVCASVPASAVPLAPAPCREEAAEAAAAATASGAQQQQQQQQQQPASALSDDDDLSFEELVDLAQPSDLALDSYSMRGVLNAAPRSAAVLSSLKLAPDRFLQRYAVVSASGAPPPPLLLQVAVTRVGWVAMLAGMAVLPTALAVWRHAIRSCSC